MTLANITGTVQPIAQPSLGKGSDGFKAWRDELPRLAHLDLPLLATGAESPQSPGELKAPANLRTGHLLKGWPTAKHSVADIQGACDAVISVGTRTGADAHGLLVFDIDGETALDWLAARGLDPAAVSTWQIHRDTDSKRLKVAFQLTEQQQQELGQIKTKVDTKPAVEDVAGNVLEKGEAVELFHQGCSQVIVLGQHYKSQGNYFWPVDMGPEDLAPIPEGWWQAALTIASTTPTTTTRGTSTKSSSGDWNSLSDCPICGRNTSDYCAQHRDGKTIRCFHGSTFAPPTGLKAGELHTDRHGTIWAYSRTGPQSNGDVFSTFVEPELDKQAIRKKTAKTKKTSLTATEDKNKSNSTDNYSKPYTKEIHEVVNELESNIGKLSYNTRTGEVIATNQDEIKVLSGNDIGKIYLQLSNQREKWPKETTSDAVVYLAQKAPFDSVKVYLETNTAPPLPIDQWQRLDKHLLGIDDPIAAACLPRFFIAAVARTMQPGCYVRQTPILIGAQERGKTELGRILFGADNWVEGIGNLDKDALMKAHTAWGVELAELDGLTRRADQESLKAFLTEKTDTYRKPYDRAPERYHRRFVFWGTSNGAPLRDTTGSTRFVCIPIPDRPLPLEWAKKNRNSLWAMALEQFNAGVDWIKTNENMRSAIAERNINFQEIDPWGEEIAEYLNKKLSLGQTPIKVTEILNYLRVPKERQNTAAAKRVAAIAAGIGWIQERRRVIGEQKIKGFWPIDSGHTGHTSDTPRGARDNASDSNGSQLPGTPDTPKDKELVEITEEQQATTATTATTAEIEQESLGTFKRFGVSGVPTPEIDCATTLLSESPVCPEVCPEHLLPRQ
jgi:predicted P-loop ATPase